jgi:hypothetical protein
VSAGSGQWRRIARTVAGHASRVLPGARSGWAEAMRRELDYIEDDRAALRWAIGCVMAGYAERLAALPRSRWQVTSGSVVAGSALLLIAMVLQVHASDRASSVSLQQRGYIERCRARAVLVHAKAAASCGASDEREAHERID